MSSRLQTQEQTQTLIHGMLSFLEQEQRADGAWTDYQLITGESTSWVTAYVGVSLLQFLRESGIVEEAFQERMRVQAMVDRAKTYLLGSEFRGHGAWGYNENLFPDADTTAITLQFLLQAGVDVDHPAVERGLHFLASVQQEDGGCSTYSARMLQGDAYIGWTSPHLSVTMAAAEAWRCANSAGESTDRLAQALAYLAAHPLHDGLWSDYWWVGPYYSVGVVISAAVRTGRRDLIAAVDVVSGLLARQHTDGGFGDVHDESDAFATAWAVSSLCEWSNGGDELSADVQRAVSDALTWLRDKQLPNGGYAPGAYMRIPTPTLRPEDMSHDLLSGRISLDVKGIFTTASVLRAVSLSLHFHN